MVRFKVFGVRVKRDHAATWKRTPHLLHSKPPTTELRPADGTAPLQTFPRTADLPFPPAEDPGHSDAAPPALQAAHHRASTRRRHRAPADLPADRRSPFSPRRGPGTQRRRTSCTSSRPPPSFDPPTAPRPSRPSRGPPISPFSTRRGPRTHRRRLHYRRTAPTTPAAAAAGRLDFFFPHLHQILDYWKRDISHQKQHRTTRVSLQKTSQTPQNILRIATTKLAYN
ncbi:Hypothetical predicted protein [Xyrichtys novacula]|uniref:Uncharacterized protein n=1 Tax=Xyrichtys novacula TaxID=13765 RepID=A0AAV1HAP1_XYRNO|nr:Hypothetical predicted protein [Xyrichtys novacula]